MAFLKPSPSVAVCRSQVAPGGRAAPDGAVSPTLA